MPGGQLGNGLRNGHGGPVGPPGTVDALGGTGPTICGTGRWLAGRLVAQPIGLVRHQWLGLCVGK